VSAALSSDRQCGADPSQADDSELCVAAVAEGATDQVTYSSRSLCIAPSSLQARAALAAGGLERGQLKNALGRESKDTNGLWRPLFVGPWLVPFPFLFPLLCLLLLFASFLLCCSAAGGCRAEPSEREQRTRQGRAMGTRRREG
jgi:hypothetical protein